MMKNSLSDVIPLVALNDLVNSLIPQKIEEINSVEISIKIENYELNIRELSAFLSFLDRVYGRIKDWNLSSYSHLPNQQLKIETVRLGSVEIVISEILVQAKENLTAIVILYAAIKILNPMSEFVKRSAESYKLIAEAKKLLSEEIKNKAEVQKLLSETNKLDEETKLVELNRQKLEREDNLNLLNTLDKKRVNQIFKLMKEIYIREEKSLPKVKKFTDEKVKEIELKVKGNKDL